MLIYLPPYWLSSAVHALGVPRAPTKPVVLGQWVGWRASIHPSLLPSLLCLSRVEPALGIGIVKWGSRYKRSVIHSLLQHPAAQKNINPKQMCY